VMAKEWFNDKQIWLMLFRELSGGLFINCESADGIAQITPDNRNQSFSGDRAVVSNNYKAVARGARWRGPSQTLRLGKSCLNDKQIRYPARNTRLQPLLKNPQPVSAQDFFDLCVAEAALD